MATAIVTIIFALGFTIALLAFFWGLVIYFWHVGTNEGGRKHGKAMLLAGATALVVLMFLTWVVQWVGTALGIEIFIGL